MKEHIAKLFNAEAGPRAMLWLEGKRLEEAGFVPGDTYTQVWLEDSIVFVACGGSAPAAQPLRSFTRKVNNQGGNPALRVEGKPLQALFDGFESVKVTYALNGTITVKGHERVQEQQAA